MSELDLRLRYGRQPTRFKRGSRFRFRVTVASGLMTWRGSVEILAVWTATRERLGVARRVLLCPMNRETGCEADSKLLSLKSVWWGERFSCPAPPPDGPL